MRAPTFETSRFAFYTLRTGATLIRKSDGRSVYFKPGDDTARALASVGHCAMLPEMYAGENAAVFNTWARNHF